MLKNDDYLDICFSDQDSSKRRFIYEIDSLKMNVEMPFGNV
jgi:hypothetical protein